jgi:alkylhydroperoxidase family enzyme
MSTPEHEHDSFTYTLTELGDRFAVFRQDSMKATQNREITVSINQWHAWNRPVQITARMGPV